MSFTTHVLKEFCYFFIVDSSKHKTRKRTHVYLYNLNVFRVKDACEDIQKYLSYLYYHSCAKSKEQGATENENLAEHFTTF